MQICESRFLFGFVIGIDAEMFARWLNLNQYLMVLKYWENTVLYKMYHDKTRWTLVNCEELRFIENVIMYHRNTYIYKYYYL